MRYVEARLKQHQREETYRIYLTDALKAISESASNIAGGRYMEKRYADFFKPEPAKEKVQEEPKTAEEFYSSFIKKAIKKKER